MYSIGTCRLGRLLPRSGCFVSDLANETQTRLFKFRYRYQRLRAPVLQSRRGEHCFIVMSALQKLKTRKNKSKLFTTNSQQPKLESSKWQAPENGTLCTNTTGVFFISSG